ncbi:hypothetical protein GCM10007159_07160 [Modicisalibacter luteus]|nr:hypothetical protein GCM10007159_07160 [Halomonas lutea]
MLDGRPALHIRAAFTHQLEYQVGAEAMDLGQVSTDDSKQGRTNIEGWGIGVGVPMARGGEWLVRDGRRQRESLQRGFDDLIAYGNMLVITVVQGERSRCSSR